MAEGMKVVITGASSFVGCHLAVGLQAAGCAVIGTALDLGDREGPEGDRLRYLADQAVPMVTLEMREAAEVHALVERERPDVWIQHAGYTRAYGAWDYDLDTGFAINVTPLKAIYEAMHAVNGAVIVTGTVSEYADHDEAHTEEEICHPPMPYGLAKFAETLHARLLAEKWQVPTRVARLFLPVGPLDAPGKLLPSVIDSLQSGAPIDLSPCEQQRDLVHVADVVELYRLLLAYRDGGLFEIFNVCSGEAPMLKEVILHAAEVLEADPALCRFGARPMREGEPPVMLGSNAKARTRLGWQPAGWREIVRRLCHA